MFLEQKSGSPGEGGEKPQRVCLFRDQDVPPGVREVH